MIEIRQDIRTKTVGIADWQISNSADEALVTHSLGSCIGVVIHDARLGIGGLGHFMAPFSGANRDKSRTHPNMYVDTGFALMLQSFYDAGSRRGDLVIKVAGGARMMDEKDQFRIGHKNVTVFRKLMWKNSLMIHGEDVGGLKPRTLYHYIADGFTVVRSGGEERSL